MSNIGNTPGREQYFAQDAMTLAAELVAQPNMAAGAFNELRAERDALRAEYAELRAQLDAEQSEHQHSIDAKNALRTKLDSACEQFAVLMRERDALRAQVQTLAEGQIAHAAAAGRVADGLRAEVERLRRALQACADELAMPSNAGTPSLYAAQAKARAALGAKS